jgi:RimK-like ATP-grasp domain
MAMPSNIIIYSYSGKSKSAKALADGLGARVITRKSNYIPSSTDKVLNWGCSSLPSWWKESYLNIPISVGWACNKVTTLTSLTLYGVRTVEYTEYVTKAIDWVDNGYLVYARTNISGHSGEGIVLMTDRFNTTLAPLYTKFLDHDREFRVHVMEGTVIDAVEKVQRDPDTQADIYIRSNKRGWKFIRKVIIPQDVLDQAIKAVKALGLDFGAVDIGYKTIENKAYVFEVNTACGLQNTTLDKYIQGFKNVYF